MGPRTAAGSAMTQAPDPFYTRLAQLLPDVDIVVLPPEPSRQPQPALDPAEARRAAELAAVSASSSLRTWWPMVTPAGLDLPDELTARWRPGGDGAHVDAVAAARTLLSYDGDKRALLEAALDAMVATGCTVVRDRPDVGLLRFEAGDCVLEVHSPPDVAWWAVSASVPRVRVDQLATALATAPPTSTPWKPESE